MSFSPSARLNEEEQLPRLGLSALVGIERKGRGKMRKLSVNTFLTLDGVMQAPGGPEEDPTGGFAHGGWSANYWDDEMFQIMAEAMSTPFDLVLGRRTYEIFAAHWPYATDDPLAKPLNDAAKYVASRTLRSLDWSNSVLIEGDVGEGIAALKQQEGPPLYVHGSSNLIQTLLRHNLIDEYTLWTFPVVVGPGKRLFADGSLPAGLKLVDSKVSATGVVVSTYVPAGELVIGSFAMDEPTDAEIERRRKLET
jgi:dihydrofolate reductase